MQDTQHREAKLARVALNLIALEWQATDDLGERDELENLADFIWEHKIAGLLRALESFNGTPLQARVAREAVREIVNPR